MKIKHIVTKATTRTSINSGRVLIGGFSTPLAITSDRSTSVSLVLDGWLQADGLRATAKLFKRLADALDREEVL